MLKELHKETFNSEEKLNLKWLLIKSVVSCQSWIESILEENYYFLSYKEDCNRV